MWTYHQRSGELWHGGKKVWTGYSGFHEGKNNPAMQKVPRVGPIPLGLYKIGAPYNSERVGPYALPLIPQAGTDTFGRDAFRCHGDSPVHPGEASRGCIIMPRDVRGKVFSSGDGLLEVV